MELGLGAMSIEVDEFRVHILFASTLTAICVRHENKEKLLVNA